MISGILLASICIGPAALLSRESTTQVPPTQSADTSAEAAAKEETAEVSFGREVAARIIGRFGLYENPDVTRYVNLVGSTVTMNTNRPELAFHFAVLNTEEIGSYSAPGGYVFITKGALLAMQDEAELAGVLAHEIAHVVNMDMANKLHFSPPEAPADPGIVHLISGPFIALMTAFSPSEEQDDSKGTPLDILFKDGYIRKDELIADKAAVHYAALAGYDSGGFVRLLERLESRKTENTKTLDMTHPAYFERTHRLKATIKLDGLDITEVKSFKERFDGIKTLIK